MNNYSVTVIGLGYVGITMSVFLANKGVNVIGIDIDYDKVKHLSAGISPIYEKNIEKYLVKALNDKKLSFTTDYNAVLKTNISFITVGTPSNPEGSININYVKNAVKSIGELLKEKKDYHLIVTRSTVIPGTNHNVIKPILEKNSGKKIGKDFGLCMNPEFLKEGNAMKDLEKPSRIVIGEFDKNSGDLLEKFYRQVYRGLKIPIIRTYLSTAELIKYANNAFLATKISFINMISRICDKLTDCDINTIAYAIGLDPRISPLFLRAGLGYGGSCLPKDVKALISFLNMNNLDSSLLYAVNRINNTQPLNVIKICEQALQTLKNKKISILGLAFKPDTDDIRNSPSLKIIDELIHREAHVTLYDPKAVDKVKKIFAEKISYSYSVHQCINQADCVIIATEWDEFKKLTPQDFLKSMKKPIIIDGRGIYNHKEFREKGIVYKRIGLGPYKI